MRSHIPSIRLILGMLLLLSWLPDPVVAQGCAMCQTVVSSQESVVRGFNWSILFLMTMPYMIALSVAGWIFYTKRTHIEKTHV